MWIARATRGAPGIEPQGTPLLIVHWRGREHSTHPWRSAPRRAARAVAPLLVAILAAGCTPRRNNPHDQGRCQPACGAGQTCYEGACVARDGGPRDGPAADTAAADRGAADRGVDAGGACAVCGAACVAACGDGTCDVAESCLDCPQDCACAPAGCGDGLLQPGEQCDDGNRDDADLCSNACALQPVTVAMLAVEGVIEPSRVVLAAAGAGSVLVAWAGERSAAVLLRRFTIRGAPIDAAPQAPWPTGTTKPQPIAALPFPGSSVALLWSQQKALGSGTFANGCALAPGATEVLVGAIADKRSASAMLAPPASQLVAWSARTPGSADTSGTAIFGQRFAGDGTAEDPAPQLINTTFAGDQTLTSQALAGLDQGGFVVVWTDGQADGVDEGIKGRLFDAAATPRGPDFAINARTVGRQQYPRVAQLPGVGFVVAWEDSATGSREIRYRRFDNAGTPLDAEERLANVTTAGAQELAWIVANDAGEFLVLWWDYAGCEGGCPEAQARGRRFTASGAPRSATELVLADGVCWSTALPAIALPAGDFLVAHATRGSAADTEVPLRLQIVPR